jgi:hypothetical protein
MAGLISVAPARERVDATDVATASSGAMFLPGVDFYAQPAVRGRRASRLEVAPENVREIAGYKQDAAAAGPDAAATGSAKDGPGSGGGKRRSSVLLADAVASNSLSLPGLVALVDSAVAGQDPRRTTEAIAGVGHLAMRSNIEAERASRPGGGIGHREVVAWTAAVSGVTVGVGKAGAIESIVRALNRFAGERELVLRACWALEHILAPPDNQAIFANASGMQLAELLVQTYRWDRDVLAAARTLRLYARMGSFPAPLRNRCLAGAVEGSCCCLCWAACRADCRAVCSGRARCCECCRKKKKGGGGGAEGGGGKGAAGRASASVAPRRDAADAGPEPGVWLPPRRTSMTAAQGGPGGVSGAAKEGTGVRRGSVQGAGAGAGGRRGSATGGDGVRRGSVGGGGGGAPRRGSVGGKG